MIFEETNICFQSYPVYIDHLVFYRLGFSRATGGVIELGASTFRQQEHQYCLSVFQSAMCNINLNIYILNQGFYTLNMLKLNTNAITLFGEIIF